MTSEMPTPPRTMSFTESTLSVLLRALPVKHGRHRLLDKIRNQPWPQATQLVRMNYRGHNLLMQNDDLVGWHFLILKTFDPEVAEVLCAAASGAADAVFWDIGANKGPVPTPSHRHCLTARSCWSSHKPHSRTF